MQLHASYSDPLNTQLLDVNNNPVYDVVTHRRLFGRGTTTIFKSTFDSRHERDKLAEVEWHRWSKTLLHFRGTTMNATDYISRAGARSRYDALLVFPYGTS